MNPRLASVSRAKTVEHSDYGEGFLMEDGNLVLGLSKNESIVISNGTDTIVIKSAIVAPKNGKQAKAGRRIAIQAGKEWKIYRVKNRNRPDGRASDKSNATARVPKVLHGLKRRVRDDERGAPGSDQKSLSGDDVRGSRGNHS